MTIFCDCSLISIERIRPIKNWLCLNKLEIEIDFPSSFQKTGTISALADTSSFSPQMGKPKSFLGKQECRDLLDHPAHAWAKTKEAWFQTLLFLEKKSKSGSTLLPALQYSETGLSTETFLSPQGFDADLWQFLMGEYSVMTYFYLSLSPERAASRCAAVRKSWSLVSW